MKNKILEVGDVLHKMKVFRNSGGEDELIKSFEIDRITKTLAFSGYAKFKREPIFETNIYNRLDQDVDSHLISYKYV